MSLLRRMKRKTSRAMMKLTMGKNPAQVFDSLPLVRRQTLRDIALAEHVRTMKRQEKSHGV